MARSKLRLYKRFGLIVRANNQKHLRDRMAKNAVTFVVVEGPESHKHFH